MSQQIEIWQILQIDDDEDDHIIVRDMLKETHGRKVFLEWAPTLELARLKLLENHYDAVLVDYDMGAGTGIDLISDLFSQGYPAPLILLTGRGSYAVDMEAMFAGATLYLTKNEINPLLLERSIRYAIERKQYEQDLVERDRKLTVALDAAQLGTWMYRFDDQMMEMDERAQQMYASPGIPRRSREEILQKHIHPDDHANIRDAFEKASVPDGDGRYQVEYRILHPDGRICWLSVRGLAEFEGQGAKRHAVRLTGASRDITEERRLQQENRRQRERLERLIQSAPIAIAFLKGPQHIFELVNPQYMKIARGKGELVGRSMADVWPEIADVIIPQLDRAYLSGERFIIDDSPFNLRRDGVLEKGFFTYSFIPIYQSDGSIEGILNLAMETTDAVRERQAAQAQTERLEAVLNALPVGVWITDAQGNIVQKNQQADRIWAGDAPLTVGTDYGEYMTWDAETGRPLEPQEYPMAITIRTGEPIPPSEYRIRRFDGSEGYVLVSIEPIRDKNGTMVGAVAINVDITDRKVSGSSK